MSVQPPTQEEELLLTDFTQLKGCSCKIPQQKLLALLKAGGFEDDESENEKQVVQKAEALSGDCDCKEGEGNNNNNNNNNKKQQTHEPAPGTGDDVGMDCSIEELSFRVPVPSSSKGETEPLFLISSTDFFFPSVEDATAQGAVGAANVVSDLCAMGIDKPDTVLMLLAASVEMDEEDRTRITIELIRGFNSTVKKCGSRVTGGQSVYNPWPLIGGTAVAVLPESQFIRPTNLKKGDVLVLTKPLGTQLGVNLRHWSKRPTRLYEDFIKNNMSQEEIDKLYELSVESMSRLNSNGARMMRKYRSNGGTDITGFGLLGHAKNLGAAQPDKKVKIVVHTLPILVGAEKADKLMKNHYKLMKGLSAETSGGLMFAVENEEAAKKVVRELSEDFNEKAWIIGSVEERKLEDPPALIREDFKTIHVSEL